MDSKQKFLRNKHWKRKYRPRNATNSVNAQKSLELKKKDLLVESEEESDNDILKQPIPKDGWFPEYDSSSSSSDIENFDSVVNNQNVTSSSSLKNVDRKTELENIQLSVEINDTKIIKDKSILKSQENVENQADNSDIEIKILEKNKDSKSIDNEEAELDFLLSLKEPIFTGPIMVKKSVENERKITIHNCVQQTPIKSIDLEKWLDSVLDE